jgi:tetratricopeptide (TPR) repeat protein
MYLKTPTRYTPKSRRRRALNLRWLWLYILVPVLLIPLVLAWQYQEPVRQWIETQLNDFPARLNPPTATPPLPPSGYAQRYRDAIQNGRLSAAVEALRGLAEVQPNDVEAHFRLAQMIILRGAYGSDTTPELLEDANKAAQRAISADPEVADGWIAQALVLDWSGKPQEALPYALRARDISNRSADKNPMAQVVLAEVYYDLGKGDLAITLLDEVLGTSGKPAQLATQDATGGTATINRPALAHAHFVRAKILRESDGKAAIREFEQAWQIASADLTIPIGYIASELITTYMIAQQTKPATDIATKAIERDKDDPLLKYLMGRLFQQAGEFEQAQKYFSECLELDAEQPKCLRNLAFLFLYRQQNYKKAAEIYQKLIDKGSKDPTDYLHGGRAYESQRLCEAAILVLQRGVTITEDAEQRNAFEDELRKCGATAGIQPPQAAGTQAATAAADAAGGAPAESTPAQPTAQSNNAPPPK